MTKTLLPDIRERFRQYIEEGISGRALKGQRRHAPAPLGVWYTQTFIAGLSADGLIAP